MQRKIVFEIAWLAGLLVLSFLISIVPGIRPLDINMHDTYVMVDGHTYKPSLNSYLVVLYIVIVCIFYFIRCIVGRFRDIIANVGLFIIAATALFFFGDIVTTFTVSQIHHSFIPGIRHWFYLLRITLWIILVFDVFMIGWNQKFSFNRNK